MGRNPNLTPALITNTIISFRRKEFYVVVEKNLSMFLINCCGCLQQILFVYGNIVIYVVLMNFKHTINTCCLRTTSHYLNNTVEVKLTHCGLVTQCGIIGLRKTLAQVMTFCITTPSHYLNQSSVRSCGTRGQFHVEFLGVLISGNLGYEFEHY